MKTIHPHTLRLASSTMYRLRRPSHALRLETLETRVNPATIEILSQTIAGSLYVSSTDPESDWTDSGSLSNYGSVLLSEPGEGNQAEIAMSRTFDAFDHLSAHVGTVLSFVEGTGEVSVEITFRIAPEAGQENGMPQPLMLQGSILGFHEANLASLSGPGVSFLRTAEFTEGGLGVLAEMGGTYVLRVQANVNSEVGGPDMFGYADLGLRLLPGVTVVAQYDDASADEVFGHYISGVKLKNTFTVDSLDPGVTGFRLTVDGVPNAMFTKAKRNGGTPFEFDMGLLRAGPGGTNTSYLVRAEALGPGGSVRYIAEGEIRVIGKVGMDLQVKAVLDEGAHRPVEEARIIAGVKKGPDLDFKPAIPDIPNFYQGRLALSFVKTNTNNVLRQLPIADIQGGQGTMLTPAPAKYFKDLILDSGSFDYDIILTALAKYKAGKTLVPLSDPEHLRVIQQPLWLKKNATGKGAGVYVKDEDTAEHLGSGAAGYKFIVDTGKPYNLPLPLSKNTPFDILKKLKSGVSLEANFSVYATLFEDVQPVVAADKFLLKGKFIGIDVFEAELDDDMLAVTASLDARTLSEPNSVRIATAGPANLLPLFGGAATFERSFGPWKMDIPIFTAGYAGLKGTVTMNGKFTAAITKLDLTGDVTFNFENSKIARSETTGNLLIDMSANATATLGLAGSVEAYVPVVGKVNLLNAQATGSFHFNLDAKVGGTFGGSKGIKIDPANTNANLTIGFSFDYDISVLTEDPDPPEMWHSEDSETSSIWELLL